MNQTFTPPVPPPVVPPVCAVNPVVGAIKRLGRSPLFLCLCIFQTIAAGLTLLSSLGFLVNTPSVLDFEGMEISTDSNLLSFVIPALFAMGLWMIRHACRNDVSPFVTTGGLKTVKVLVTIQLVFMYILTGCIPLLIFGLFALGGVASELFSDPAFYGEFEEEFLDEFSEVPSFDLEEALAGGAMIGISIVLLFVLAVLVYMIVYYHSLRRGVTAVMENAEGILTDRSFSMFTIVTFYIAGGCVALSTLTTIALLPIAGLASGAMATVYILGGVLMGRYRKEMQQLRLVSSGAVPAPFGMNEQPFAPAPVPFTPEAVPVAEAVPAPETVPAVEVAPVPAVDIAPVAEPVSQPEPTPVAHEFCSGCGRKRGEGENFCPGCGKPFSN